ncbi:DegT/DnrJ/EryC1/StrS family aminotransferase [uncultured Helicobacter sp.]|uniref:DegT/DnrJ/EryC1/StrS family aminotransferase n=1 Tax=uncultured Helicobacter sp. TaxID=175537 RepID=UPI00374EA4AF
MDIQFINLKAQYKAYKSEIDTAIAEVLDSSAYIMGPSVGALESDLSAFCGARYTRAVSSGTDALLIALMALGIQRGDEVITTPFTFIATAEMIALLGAKPVFVDIDEATYNIDPAKIESAITPRTKAIIPVSLYGLPADMDAINAIAKAHNLAVIEDACQSFGATYKNRYSCNLSHIGVTSFFPSKPLGCYGDGGAVFCNDEELDSKIGSILNHGQIGRYIHKYIGLNGRLDSIQCAVLGVKLKHFREEIVKREEIARIYTDNLCHLNSKTLILPTIPQDRTSVYAQYSVRVCGGGREAVLEALQARGVPTAVHYPLPLHLQESLAYLGYVKGDFPVSEKVANEIFSLPFSAFLSDQEQGYIIESLRAVLG